MSKCDPKLGQLVRERLVSLGIETPMIDNAADHEHKVSVIQESFGNIMDVLGLDRTDDSLQDTPRRVAEMYVDETFRGLNYDNFPKCTAVDNKIGYDELIVERCSLKTTCEHHFVYFGTAHDHSLSCWVAYIPNKKVLGLSKLSRIVDFFSRRPQIQERLTAQIAEAIKVITGSEHVGVVMKGQHFCVLTRGIGDAEGLTITSSLHGGFRENDKLRTELVGLIK